MQPIDAVLPWVDGNDPILAAKRAKYIKKKFENDSEIAASTRYRSVGEIKYSVASLLRFAPFLRNIYIVTDQQNPGLEEMIMKYFPGKKDSIKIVDHTVIFRGYEEYLPTFNSTTIETLIWNIPGLSENFLYTNDDLFLLEPLVLEDYYKDGHYTCHGSWYSIHRKWYLRPFNRKYSIKKNGWYCMLYNGMRLISNGSRYIFLAHAPKILNKSWFEEFVRTHPEAVKRNLESKFRSEKQWQVHEPFFMDMYLKGKCTLKSSIGFFFKGKDKNGYITRKIKQAEGKSRLAYICSNSLDMSNPEQIPIFTSWLGKRLGIE